MTARRGLSNPRWDLRKLYGCLIERLRSTEDKFGNSRLGGNHLSNSTLNAGIISHAFERIFAQAMT